MMLCRLSEEALGLSEHTDMVVVGALIELILVRSGEFRSRTGADERKSRVDAVGYEYCSETGAVYKLLLVHETLGCT